MDPKKNRRWVMAALAAAAVVFLVMAGGEAPTAGPGATPTTANAVLASGTGSSSGTGASSNSSAPSGNSAPSSNNAFPGGSAPADHNGASAGHSGSADTGVSSGSAANDGAAGNGAANDSAANDSAGAVERNAVLDFLRQLLDALGISPEELVGSANNSANGSANNSANGNANNNADSAAGAGSGAARDNAVQVEEPAASAATASITIANFAFGQPVTVAPGATVEVQNTDTAPHNVTADDGSFATDNIAQNQTTTFVAPTRPGRYAYSCTLHPEMTGTLIVQAEAGTGAGAAGDAPPGAGAGTARSNGSSGSTPQDTQTGGSATRAPQGGATGNAEPSRAPSTGSGYGSGNGY
jgi:plastocyanin